MGWGNEMPIAELKRHAARVGRLERELAAARTLVATARADAIEEFVAAAKAELDAGAGTWLLPYIAEAIDRLHAVRDRLIGGEQHG